MLLGGRLRRRRAVGRGRRSAGPGGDARPRLRRAHLGDRLRLAAGPRRARVVAGHRGRRRADPRDPHRRRRIAAVPALRLPRADPGAWREPRCRSATSSRTACCAAPCSTRPARCRASGFSAAAASPAIAGERHRRGRRARRRRRACARGWSPPPTARIRRCAAPPASARSSGAIARSASSRPWRMSGRMPASRSNISCPSGPFAILPMTDEPARPGHAPRGRSSIVWTEHADLAPRLLALPEAEFAAELRARFGGFLGADRAGRAALELQARADAGRALRRAAAWRWSARRRM